MFPLVFHHRGSPALHLAATQKCVVWRDVETQAFNVFKQLGSRSQLFFTIWPTLNHRARSEVLVCNTKFKRDFRLIIAKLILAFRNLQHGPEAVLRSMLCASFCYISPPWPILHIYTLLSLLTLTFCIKIPLSHRSFSMCGFRTVQLTKEALNVLSNHVPSC